MSYAYCCVIHMSQKDVPERTWAFNCHLHVDTLGCELGAGSPHKETEVLLNQSLFSSGFGRYEGNFQLVLVYCSSVSGHLS